MTGTLRLVTGALALGLIAAAAAPLRAQDPTLDDVKKEVMRRAEVSGPFVGILREDAERIVQALKSLDEFLKIAPSLSLKDQGLLDKPSAPILCVNGKLDDQAPVEDIYLLAEHGRPKEVRIYPEGGHMGRTPGMEPSEITNLITGWLKLRLSQ